MGDPMSLVSYYDPYDLPLPQTILNYQNRTFVDLPIQHYSTSLPQPNHVVLPDSDHDLYSGQIIPDIDIMVQNFSHEADPSQLHAETTHPSHHNWGFQNFPEVVNLSTWPEHPVPFICSCCHVLREIVHTNGIKFTKLEIHGRLGMICHAIQQQDISVGSSDSQHRIQMIDFCRRSIEEIKNFLMQYCMEQNAAGYFVVQDPLSIYYEALCTGLDWTEDINDEFLDQNIDNSGTTSDEAEDMERTPRTCLAAQRERAAKMKLSDFSDYFHLPIDDAAKEVNLCPTVVKKICRKEGLARWPHRKIKSIVKKIKILRGTLNSRDAMSRAQTQGEIERFHQEMIQHCGGIAPTSLNLDA